ncbi:MAG TPA: septal ring lytic transglycosylase RlpA family protein [Nevskiaceae bacterium]|nr:septal ring lytic transglycosylase RlpA family protein [Nevskiaceae bacterium]
MTLRRIRPASLVVALLITACASQPGTGQRAPRRQVQIPPPRVSATFPPDQVPRRTTPGAPAPERPERDGPPDPRDIPDLSKILEPVPKDEPLSRSGNPPSYEVFGKTYYTLNSSEGFKETGLASWYGRKFHGQKTSSGEPYDMFQLTAAHKRLPLPTYARVTNLANGRSVVVRINDRGPFHPARVIDLSYAAAAKLETVGKIAMVEIEAITPGRELPPPPKAIEANTPQEYRITKARALQVAAYSDPINAISMKEELLDQGIKPVTIRVGQLENGDTVHRVIVGPFEERQRMDEARIQIRGAGYEAIPVLQ